jgi:hypothetical protein
VTDYIDYSFTTDNIPEGKRKILYVNTVNPVQESTIQASATAAPGSVWYVLGEPNGRGIPVESVLAGLHDTYQVIKDADPTALITSPSILNFNFTCIGCGGFQSGAEWIAIFRDQYLSTYGEEPPIDIWAIDAFPIIWPVDGDVEAAFPNTRSDIVIAQIAEYREWIDSIEASEGKPIWITEFGLHWGFSDWVPDSPGCPGPLPAGEYETDAVRQYLSEVYTWLEENSDALNIERWFTFSSYRDIDSCQADSGNGLSLLDSIGIDGQLTEIGGFFLEWIKGSP